MYRSEDNNESKQKTTEPSSLMRYINNIDNNIDNK